VHIRYEEYEGLLFSVSSYKWSAGRNGGVLISTWARSRLETRKTHPGLLFVDGSDHQIQLVYTTYSLHIEYYDTWWLGLMREQNAICYVITLMISDRERTWLAFKSQAIVSIPLLNMVRFCGLGPSLDKPGRAKRIQNVPSSRLTPRSASFFWNRPAFSMLYGVSIRKSPSTVGTQGNTFTHRLSD